MRGWDRCSAVMLLGLVAGVIGCGGGGAGGDAVAADVGLSDAEAGEILADAEVDGTDSVTDVIADVADTPDTQDADVTDTGDVPYWIAHDIDISGLGVVNPKGSAQCDVYLKVKPGDPPTPPACAAACPAPYPCTCGTCPWIETPPMLALRAGAKALWTGEEVLVFGGANQTGIGGGPPTLFTAERWNPSGTKGFEPIDLPFTATTVAGGNIWTLAFWTGSQALVVQEQRQFLFDPKANTVQQLPLAPVLNAGRDSIVWTGNELLWWGWDRATTVPGNAVPAIAAWDPQYGWQSVALPTELVKVTPGAPRCITSLDGEVYVFDPPGMPLAAAGLDPTKPVLLRYTPVSKTWVALPQTMLPNVRCATAGNVLFASFPDGIAFIPAIDGIPGSSKYPPVGEIWWKKTGHWTAMATPPVIGPFNPIKSDWLGKSFLLSEVTFADPMTTSVLGPDAGGDDGPTWPILYDPFADKFEYLTSVGFPKHVRRKTAMVSTGTEVFELGGSNGTNFQTMHNDGVRLRLPTP